MSAPLYCLEADAGWRAVDFISDLHLQAEPAQTFEAWRDYLLHTPAQAIFMLGDVFEVWIGDDAALAGSFEDRCARVLQQASQRCALFLLHGNRDFLLGEAFARRAGCTLLPDPCVLQWQGQRWLLSHGDALCLADQDYMQFRQLVRSSTWQAHFLQQPLVARLAAAQTLRQQSEARKRTQTVYADADSAMVQAWLDAAQAATLIHGHTHQPHDHALPRGRQRVVLSDWDLAAQPPRAQVLRLHRPTAAAPARLERLTLAQSLSP